MKVVFIIFAILFSSCNLEKKPQLVIPDERKDKIFTNFINPITEKYGLQKLRETSLSSDDLEIRIWTSVFETDGFILKKNSGKWSALAIKEIDCNKINYYKGEFYQTGKIKLSPPKSGWEKAWGKLVNEGMLDLPYSYYVSMIDEGNYAIETSIDGIYKIRFYGYLENSEEAKKMRKVGEIIADEFGLGNFKVSNMCL